MNTPYEKYKISNLANGLIIATRNLLGNEASFCGLYVSSGARHEEDYERGIAHGIEHMLHKDNEKRTAEEVNDRLEMVGSRRDAMTSPEDTVYFVWGGHEQTSLAIETLAQQVRYPVLSQKQLELEKRAIQEEVKRNQGVVSRRDSCQIMEAAYQDQNIGRSVIGAVNDIENFSSAKMQNFLENHYQPDNIILFAYGNVDHDEVVEIAKNNFGDMAKHKNEVKAVEPARFTEGEIRTDDTSYANTHFTIAFEGTSLEERGTPKHYESEILAKILGGGNSSRLSSELRGKEGIVYDISVESKSFSDTGMITISTEMSGDNIPKAIDVICEQINDIASNVTQKDIDIAKAMVITNKRMNKNALVLNPDDFFQIRKSGTSLSIDEEIKGYEDVTIENIQDLTKKLIDGKMATSSLGPQASKMPSNAEISSKLFKREAVQFAGYDSASAYVKSRRDSAEIEPDGRKTK